MYLKRITDVFFGYVKFRAEGYYIERFINHCKNSGFELDCINRIHGTIIEAQISIKEYKEICKIARRNKCKIRIYEKKGLPFFLHKYKKRKIFIIALLIVSVALYVSSKFVWNIEVSGSNNIPKEEIIEIAKKEGLEVGKYKGSIDEKKIIDTIRSTRLDVSWVRNQKNWNKCNNRNRRSR